MDDLRHRFQYHPPLTDEVKHTHELVRAVHLRAADAMDEVLPEGREKSLCITKLEEAMFWANAAVAREQAS